MRHSAPLLICVWLMISFVGIAGAYYDMPKKGEPGQPSDDKTIQLILRGDDMGFCHASNMAFKKVLDDGVITAVSVMVISPWLEETVEILRDYPDVSVGVHLTLNSEWREYRWGPVMPWTEVPSLVDAFGKFFGSRREFFLHQPTAEDVAKELRAQLDLASRKGLKFSYCDYHMGTALSALEFQEELEKLAVEYRIGISRYFNETDSDKVYSVAPENKLEEGIKIIEGLEEGNRYLLVVHPGLDTPEMAAMTDLNAFGLKNMSKHRQAVTDMLCHPKFREAIEKKGIQLINYNQLREHELHLMTRPTTAEPLVEVIQSVQMEPKQPAEEP